MPLTSKGETRHPSAVPVGGAVPLRARILVLLLPLLAAGCGGPDRYPGSTIHPHSDFAEIIHSLYVSIFWWTMLILAVVWILLAYIVFRYRRRSEDEQPRQVRGHMGLEIGWTVGPALIVIAITIPTIQAVFETQRPIEGENLLVEVTGHQFWWEFHYPEQGVRTANELWLPVDHPVSLRLESTDVIHSFWVPLLGGKRDVNPEPAVREGEEPRFNWLFFTPQETGVYRGQCAEFCGESHAFMGMRVVVASEEDFQDWVDRWYASEGADIPAEPAGGADGEPANGDTGADGDAGEAQDAPRPQDPPQVVAGRETFLTSTCIACHAIQGTRADGVLGPNLTLFGERRSLAGYWENDEENLTRWILDPEHMKPGAQMPGVDTPGGGWPATGLSEDQARAVAAYLLSLR
jgi:cytochrome c oxidase subunit II